MSETTPNLPNRANEEYLIEKGWKYENGHWFPASTVHPQPMIFEDAVKLQRVIDNWGASSRRAR